jgi:hypothetical protein
MKTSSLAIFFATFALPFESIFVSAAPGFYRQRAHNPPSCEDMSEMMKQRDDLIKVLESISGENELAAAIATWETEKKSRQQQNLDANCNESNRRIRLLRGARGRQRQQNGDGTGANCDGGEDCEKQRLGPQMNGEGDGMGRNGAGSLFGTSKCDEDECDQQRGDGLGRGRGDRKGNNGLYAILRDISCEDEEDVDDLEEIIEAAKGSELVKNSNQPATRLFGALNAFVDECESD